MEYFKILSLLTHLLKLKARSKGCFLLGGMGMAVGLLGSLSGSAIACSELIKASLVTEELPATLLPTDIALNLGAISVAIQPPNFPGMCPDAESVVTANTICQEKLTIPSLWWAKKQFGGKLLYTWLAYPSQPETPARIDLVVNQQIWGGLKYLDRYSFTQQFGEASSDYGYNIRIFNRRGTCLATYTCDFSNQSPQKDPLSEPRQCQILLAPLGRGYL